MIPGIILKTKKIEMFQYEFEGTKEQNRMYLALDSYAHQGWKISTGDMHINFLAQK